MKKDNGLKLLEVERKSRRGIYINDVGNLRVHCNPLFNDEKERLMNLISKENKKKIAAEMGIKVRDLPKECSGKRR